MSGENEIVFEDLHGVNEDETVEVDLDAAAKDDGISRTPADQVVVDDVVDDDSNELSGLRDADNASATPDDDDAASSDSDDDGYSKKVRARIKRATRSEKAAKSEADYWKKQAEQLANRQSSETKSRLESAIEQATAGIESAETALEAAIEAGNTKDQVRLTSQLTDLKAEKIQSEVSLQDLPESGNLQPFDGKVITDSDDQSLADKWMEDRADWYGARGFERQTRLANRIDREVFDDGYKPDTPDYFRELDRRLKDKEPNLYDDAAGDGSSQRQRRTPVAPVDGADNRRQRSSGSKIQLGEQDFANMRRFNLDTNDPEVLKEYARNKRESLQGAK